MMLRGVTAGRPPLDDVLVVDIGGGSTELVLAVDGEVAFATSLDVGCVRITERFLGSDPPSRPSSPPRARTCARSSRRSRSGARDRRRGHGRRRSRRSTSATPSTTRANARPPALARLGRDAARAARCDDARRARRDVQASSPGRAPVIVAGIVVLREVLTAYGLAEIEVSERDILHGAAFAAAELPEPEEGAAPPGAYTCC